MKFIIDDSLESMIQRIAGPVEIINKDNKEYEIIGLPQDKEHEVRAAVKAHIEARGKVCHEID